MRRLNSAEVEAERTKSQTTAQEKKELPTFYNRENFYLSDKSCEKRVITKKHSTAFLENHRLSNTALETDIHTLSRIPRIPFSIG